MKTLITIISIIVIGFGCNAQKLGNFPDSCTYQIEFVSFFWKKDSLGLNGFRMMAVKSLIDCKAAPINEKYILEKLGPPNRTSTSQLEKHLIYYYLDGSKLPKGTVYTPERLYILFNFDLSGSKLISKTTGSIL